jgi:hypothetical protein
MHRGKVAHLRRVQYERPGLLMQINRRCDGVKTIAYHPVRVLDRKVDGHGDIHPTDDLLQLKFQILTDKRLRLRNLPGGKQRVDGVL